MDKDKQAQMDAALEAAADPSDPQAAAAAPALSNLVTIAADKAGKNLDAYDAMLKAAMAGDPNAQAQLAQHSLGMATMGSLNTPVAQELGAVANDISQVGKVVDAAGVETPLIGGKPDFGSVSAPEGFSKYSPKKMANGGGVDAYDYEQPHAIPMADGGEVVPAEVSQFLAPELNEEKYGSPTEQAKTGLEGAAQGILGPIAPATEQALFGAKPEDIRGRAETNPYTHGAGEIAGLGGSLLTGVGEGALAAKAGASAIKGIEGTNLASRIGSSAAKASIENGIIAAGDETSKMINEDPNTSAQTAMVDIGLSGLLGGAVGGTIGAVSPLFKVAEGTRLGQAIEDFKGRIDEHLNNPEPVGAATEELSNLYNTMQESNHSVYGPKGLKAQDIAKVVPELDEKILDQADEVAKGVNNRIVKMTEKPNSYPSRLVDKMQENLDEFAQEVSHPDATSSTYFDAIQKLKQKTQFLSKFEGEIKPYSPEYDFIQQSKALGKDLREALENKEVWGKAAERQQSINGAFSKFKTPYDEFTKKFTSELNGERVIDPGKVETYLKQAGSNKGELKQGVLKNFIDASEKYHKVIGDIHNNLGLDHPLEFSSLANVKRSLKQPTMGTKLADAFIKHGLSDVGAEAAGGATGAGLGELVGHPGIGALIGAHALAPFFKSVLPAIVKPLLEGANSAIGAKAAVDYALTVAKGQKALLKASKTLFTSSREVASQDLIKTDRLDKQLKEYQADPQALIDHQGQSVLGHYMPNHAASVAQTTGTAVQYLNSLRPNTTKASPLDSTPLPSKPEQAAFKNALQIAQNPLIVLQRVKEGTITTQDLKTLSAVAPDFYKSAQQQVTNQMIEKVNKGDMVPYRTRLGLSMFLQQPMDSTMVPNAIISAQPKPKQVPPQAPQGGKPMGNGKATLSKLPNQVMTSDQARQERQNKQ